MSAEGAVRSIKIVWELVDKATAPMKKIDERIDKALGISRNSIDTYQNASTQAWTNINTGYVKAERSITRYTDILKTKLSGISKIVEEHRMAIASIGAGLAGAGYLGLNYYSEGTKDLANYQDAYSVMVKNITGNADELIAKMKTASAGTLTDTELLMQANRAMVLGIGYDKMPKFVEASRAAARLLGGNTSDLIDSLVSGTGRQSALRLDDLGILTTGLDEFTEKWAKAHDTTIALLTSEQEGMVYIDYVMEHSNDLISKVDFSQQSLNETLKKAESSWSNVQSEMAEGALPVLSKIIDANTWLAKLLDDMPAPIKTVLGTAGLLASGMMGLFGALALNIVAASLLAQSWGGITAAMGRATLIIGAYIPASISAAYATGGLGAALWAIAVNPITLAILAIVGAAWLLWDVFDKGWDDSMLGQAVGWLYDTFPGLERWVTGTTLAFQYLSGGLGEVWKYLEPIIDKIDGALDNPYVKLILDAMWGVTPMGMMDNIGRIASGQNLAIVDDYSEILGGAYRTQEITNKAYVSQGRTQNLTMYVDASLNTGDLKTEGVTKDDLGTLLDKRDQKLQSGMNRMIKGQLISVGA